MTIEEKYSFVFEKMKDRIAERREQKRMPALGYTSNLDVLCDFSVERLNELLAEYLPEEDLQKLDKVPLIRTMQDFLSTLVYYCRTGIGGEQDMEDFSVIKDAFPVKLGMGGTATQGAMALAAVECPSLVHLTDDSKEVCDILNSEYIYTVSQDGKLVHTGELKQTQDQEVHFIIQFQKGGVVKLNDQEFTIPTSNRLIVTKVTVNEFVPFNHELLEYVENHPENISSVVLSSFNCILNDDVLRKRIHEVKKHIGKCRKNGFSGIFYFEDAHYHSEEIKKECITKLYPDVDIAGLNEEELKYTLGLYGFDVDINDIQSCVKGARFLKRRFDVKKGIVVHTKDYAMYVGDPLNADIEAGLMYGNIMATAKAMTGWYGGFDQIEEVMKLDVSPAGMKDLIEVKESDYDDVILVPSKYIDKPKYTIGLGDSFVSGVQICF